MADSNNAQIGSQVTLQYWNTSASPDVWATLGKVRQIQGIGTEKPEVDSTTLDSTAVERIGGLPDGKQVTVTLTTTAAVMAILEGFTAGTDNIDFKIFFPSPINLTRYFTLTPLGYDHGTVQPSGLLEISLMGRISGSISGTPSHP